MENIEFNLKDYLDDQFREVIKRQDHTNGSVAEAKKEINSLTIWQARILGGAAVLFAAFGIFSFILRQQIEIFLYPNEQVEQISQKVISDLEDKYQIEIRE